MKISNLLPQRVAYRYLILSWETKYTCLLFAFCFYFCLNCLKEENVKRPWYGYEQDVNFPISCIDSTTVIRVGSKFILNKGWRTSCGKEFEITRKNGSLDIYWDYVLFLRPNAVSEGFLPSLIDLADKRNFDEYRKYGIFAESALESVFSGEEVKKFLTNSLNMFQSCSLVVATASFGAQYTLHQPLNIERKHGVCYVAFIDAKTRKGHPMEVCEESWYVLELPKLIWNDPRMKTRLVRALLPFFFPHSTFSIWIDSKLQLQEDPVVLVNHHLEKRKAWLAVSENHARSNIYEEGEKLMKMFHSTLSNKTYDNFRVQALQRCLQDYRNYGFSGVGLPDMGLFLRAHTTRALEFSLYWTQEILKYPFGGDQITFPFVVWRYGNGGVNLFNKCWYVQAVREVAHTVRSGSYEAI